MIHIEMTALGLFEEKPKVLGKSAYGKRSTIHLSEMPATLELAIKH